jgi:hypothetical protein
MVPTQHVHLSPQGWLNVLSRPQAGRLLLVIAPHAAGALMLELAARLAAAGPLHVLDGGNRFNVYPMAKALRRLTVQLDAALERITLSRAFTCYQMLALLQETPARPRPTLLLDLLSTFFDESVSLREAQRLLAACLPHLKRLSAPAPLIASVKPPLPIAAARQVLVDQLRQAVDQSWVLEPVPPERLQPGLWDPPAAP